MRTESGYGATLSARTGSQILEISEFLRKLPGGSFLRNLYIGRRLPYSRRHSINIIEVLPGRCIARIKDRPKQHNDHHAIHEGLLINLAEHAARLALATALPEGGRASLTTLSMEYTGPAHGSITAKAQCGIPKALSSQECPVLVELRGEGDSRIATGMANWLVTLDSDDGAFSG
ncbi:MAG: DUF4442 domain-containing protein [bacterium]